jgi:hypothetical protein
MFIISDSDGNYGCSNPCKNCGTDLNGNYCGNNVCGQCNNPSNVTPCAWCVSLGFGDDNADD